MISSVRVFAAMDWLESQGARVLFTTETDPDKPIAITELSGDRIELYCDGTVWNATHNVVEFSVM